jgi:hypothetical protein
VFKSYLYAKQDLQEIFNTSCGWGDRGLEKNGGCSSGEERWKSARWGRSEVVAVVDKEARLKDQALNNGLKNEGWPSMAVQFMDPMGALLDARILWFRRNPKEIVA